MADFKTHVGVAAVGSGLLSSMCFGAGVTGPNEMVALAAVGTAGGMLPDIDSDYSSPIKILFTALGVSAACLAVFGMAASSSILEIWVVGGLSYLAVRYLAWQGFAKLTVHRGIFHSLVAALFFWFVAASVSYYWFKLDALLSWMVGFFLFFGYMVHLLLDEAFSIDLAQTRLKRSFGTALKIVDYSNAVTSGLMIAAMAGAFYLAPSHKPFLKLVSSGETYQNIGSRFCPELICGERGVTVATEPLELFPWTAAE